MCRAIEAPESTSGFRVVCLGVRLIVDGMLDQGVEGDLANELGVSGRHLRRMFNEYLGITPSRLARAWRLRRAARLLLTSDLTVADIAHQAGFGSIRQLNRVCRQVLGFGPIELRRRGADELAATEILPLRFSTRPDFDWAPIFGHLGSMAVPHVERVDPSSYRRVVVVDGVPGALEASVIGKAQLVVRVDLREWDGLLHVVQGALSVVDPNGVARGTTESGDTTDSPPLNAGLPGTWDPFEVAVSALLRSRLPRSDVETVTSRLVDVLGAPVQTPISPRLTRSFPTPEIVAASSLRSFGLGSSTEYALRRLAIGVADGHIPLYSTSSTHELRAALVSWHKTDAATSDYIATRIGRSASEESPWFSSVWSDSQALDGSVHRVNVFDRHSKSA